MVCAFKPQFAYFAAAARRAAARAPVHVHPRHLPATSLLILDAKRGDIGSDRRALRTRGVRSLRRRRRHRQPVPRHRLGRAVPAPRGPWRVRAVPHLATPAAATSSRSIVDGEPLYTHVARRVADRVERSIGECGLVVGATYPDELGAVRGDRRRPAAARSRRRRAGRRRRGHGRSRRRLPTASAW